MRGEGEKNSRSLKKDGIKSPEERDELKELIF